MENSSLWPLASVDQLLMVGTESDIKYGEHTKIIYLISYKYNTKYLLSTTKKNTFFIFILPPQLLFINS